MKLVLVERDQFDRAKFDSDGIENFESGNTESYRIENYPNGGITVSFRKSNEPNYDGGFGNFNIEASFSGITNGQQLFKDLKEFLLERWL